MFQIEVVVLVLLTLAAGLALANYLWTARENLRRNDLQLDRHRALRIGRANNGRDSARLVA